MLLKYKYHLIAIGIIALMAAIIRADFPSIEDYHYRADEGVYLHYSNTLHQEGFYDGMRQLADEHAEKPNRFMLPSPMRIFHLFGLWVFSYIVPGITGLSWMSLVSYVLLTLISFRFVYQHYGGVAALITTLLIATAPMGLGFSAMALMDSTHYLMILASIVVFFSYLHKPGWLSLAAFVVVHWLCIMEKDINAMLLPAFAVVWLFLFFKERGRYPFIHGVVAAAGIPLLSLLCYVTFIGWDNFMQTFTALGQAYELNIFSSYNLIYQDGPWYQFIIDFAILSPVVMLLSLFGLGYFLVKSDTKQKRPLQILLFLFATNVVFIATVSMNVRYIIYLEWFMALVVAVSLPLMLRQWVRLSLLRGVLGAAIVLLLAGHQYSRYQQLFVEHQLYDTLNYNLLQSGGVLPKLYLEQEYSKELARVQQRPEDEQVKELLNKSYRHYEKKDFEAVIATCKKVLKQDPYNADAYNTLCSAYNELDEYTSAIQACNLALFIKPNYTLAQNNVNWAVQQLMKQQKSNIENSK